jgi:ferredoxin-NADP reductase/Na+-translocating ferredoxin:NAD+ oxidoreductase RnfD subunit
MNPIDAFLNKITMYRLVLYYLTTLIVIALGASTIGVLHYSPLAILFSTIVIVAACWGSNEAFAYIFKAHPNVESVYITAFILVLIMTPVLPITSSGVIVLVIASVLAMGSKYILTIRKTHIFNPAALAVVITGIAMGAYASWWVGNLTLLPFVIIGGLLIVRKIQRFDLVLTFSIVTLFMTMLYVHESSILLPAWQMLAHSAFFFFACVMLTEPATMPSTRKRRITYGALVGLLYVPGIHLASLYSSPEISLVIGNALAYIIDPKVRLMLTLKQIENTSASTKEFIFTSDAPLRFKPGQYIEWTLPHSPSDTRGNRRYFTIASAPEDSDIRVGVKFYEPSSSFKGALLRMKTGDRISISQLNGDFTLPHDESRKAIFIAGGIGITPFVSMIRSMLATKSNRPAVLLYSCRSYEDIAYRELFDRASDELPIRIIYAVNQGPAPEGKVHIGMIDINLIKTEVPDYTDCMFYLSGPRTMVIAFERQLSLLGISRTQIKTDFFPGLV